MPFAQVHYPFENKEWFEDHYPADFIVEYINQTRGWFYTLHVLAGALFDKPSFQNVICHGILLADDGNKLSKKLRNYTEPNEIFHTQGADALRWYFMSSNIVRGGDARISDQGIADVTRQILLPIWNAYSFFTLYANIDGYRAEAANRLDRRARPVHSRQAAQRDRNVHGSDGQLRPGRSHRRDRIVHRRTQQLVHPPHPRPVLGRRRRPSSAESAEVRDKKAAYDTLYTVLVTFLKIAAPFLPMITEEIYTA